ncbi:hypothetical protein [Candidatus Acidianus copahuensis]|nr:hypothetical protein [Candidatus Acidianus copahuensis]
MMRIAVPKVIFYELSDYTIAIPTLPLIQEGEVVKKISTMKISSCDDKLQCYPSILGGIFIFRKRIPIARYEFNGFLCAEQRKGEEENINQLISSLSKEEECCFSSQSSTFCLRKKKENNCYLIDNIGMRFIV